MRPSLMRRSIPRLMLVGALVALGAPESLACSGPEAARTIQRSELIGWSFAGISIAIVAGGCSLVRRRSPGRRIRWIVAPLALHPRLWMDAVHGDCGYGLRWWSFVATLGIAAGPAHTLLLMEKALRNQAETPKTALISGVSARRRPGKPANTVRPVCRPHRWKSLQLALAGGGHSSEVL